jgi:hypothetical protein
MVYLQFNGLKLRTFLFSSYPVLMSMITTGPRWRSLPSNYNPSPKQAAAATDIATEPEVPQTGRAAASEI